MNRGRHRSFSLAWFHRQGGKTGASEDQGAPSCREGGSHPQSPHQVNSVSQGMSDALKHLQPQPLLRARAVERDKANAQIPLGSPGPLRGSAPLHHFSSSGFPGGKGLSPPRLLFQPADWSEHNLWERTSAPCKQCGYISEIPFPKK